MAHECQTYRRTTCDDERCGTTQGPLLVGAGNDQGRGSQQSRAPNSRGFGLIREIEAKPGAPIWRRDDAGQGYALKLTAAGLKAIAVDEGAQDATEPSEAPQPEAKNGASPDEGGGPARVAAPRDGSKLALVIEPSAARRRRDHRRFDSGYGMAAAHDAGGAHRAAQTRVCRDPRTDRRWRFSLPDLGRPCLQG